MSVIRTWADRDRQGEAGGDVLPDLRRVAVIGCSCAGKTTFARRLAAATGASFVELDAIHWLPNWVERPNDEFREIVDEATGVERWVADGNYSYAQDIIWDRATAVVWLNYSFPLVWYRAFTRTMARSITGRELFSGNKESLRKAFLSKDSILLWVLTTYFPRRKRYRALFDSGEYPDLNFIEFRRSRDADKFLKRLEEGASSP